MARLVLEAGGSDGRVYRLELTVSLSALYWLSRLLP